MITAAAFRSAVSARSASHRFAPRTRRLRTIGAAGFAGVSVTLLAGELPGPPPVPDGLAAPRFSTKALVDGLVAVPVRFDDPASAAFLRPGDRVDVLAAEDRSSGLPSTPDKTAAPPSEETRQRDQAAVDVQVLSVGPTPDTPGNPGFRGGNLPRTASGVEGLVLLAVDNATASRLAEAEARGRLSFALRPAAR